MRPWRRTRPPSLPTLAVPQSIQIGGKTDAANGSSPLYGIPYNVAHGNAPGVAKVNVIIDNYPGESDIVAVPIPAGAVIEGDNQNGPNTNGPGYNNGQRGDSHLLVWDADNNIAYELYGVTRPTEPTLFPDDNGFEAPHTDGLWHAAQESVWKMTAESFRSLGWTSADAAGLSILAGLARPDEGLPTVAGGQGAINHALRFTLPSGDVDSRYIYPASHMVSVSQGVTTLPLGARLRLKNTPAINTAISAMGPEAQIVARAMQQYGLVLADIGTAMYVTGALAAQDTNNNISLTWNMDDVLGLKALTAQAFDVVDLTPQVTGLSVNAAAAGSTVTIVGRNFSGSAGHLAVLFGNAPASAVTYVDDGHLTALVPAGTGTVDVRVESGVNAVDPNDPRNNVTAPIFGYGISAISGADQFTTLTQTISGTNSTAGFAASTVAAGAADLLTIVVQDTTGKSVSGLAGGAFTFTVSGGTSTGAFGAVTETATKGTYTASFTGATVGTASGVTVTIAGAALSGKPTVIVTSAARERYGVPPKSCGSGRGAGSTDLVTIMVQDAAGNPISGLSNGAVTLALSGGTSTGSFGAVSETATRGTYSAVFTGLAPGTADTLTVTVSSVVLATAPTIIVTAGPSGTIATTLPPFTWTAVPGTVYSIWLTDQTTGKITVVANLAGPSWTPAQPLVLGDKYTWWLGVVQGQSTTWNSGLDFRIAPTGTGASGDRGHHASDSGVEQCDGRGVLQNLADRPDRGSIHGCLQFKRHLVEPRPAPGAGA